MSNTVVKKKHIALKIFAILLAVILLLVIAVVVLLKMTFHYLKIQIKMTS